MKKLVFIFIVFSLFQCGTEQNSVEKPSRLMPQKEFENLVYDLNVLEGSMANFNLDRELMRDTSVSLYQGVFNKYSIDYSVYKENQEYYILSNNMKEVSENVLERVQKEAERYKDIESLKVLSFVQLTQLFENDKLMDFVNNDTTTTFPERMDSLLRFYRNHQSSLRRFTIDSLSFETNMTKLKKGKDIFRRESVFYNNKINE